ncbi:hypothetical protein SAMD00019534_054520 [Acytostelium subglobosum LB1]|uniref:hypothetical protein n=1 Tax=Acytostelium subglobosum LB1 TaxID=1410327 RepID=UPI0006451E0A|nr:hypothetical protein SAMD00019534_054520 [Acytostelium subglobosum LB1]GAM22277.1 hypothetical protein SAMD00019534_054520 [Acytostelium subglobosum LB1]|eukprot:XP_012754397.1 hypothetical protein SAMD00019534_054520 [Acytostelium subglobosum LB1]
MSLMVCSTLAFDDDRRPERRPGYKKETPRPEQDNRPENDNRPDQDNRPENDNRPHDTDVSPAVVATPAPTQTPTPTPTAAPAHHDDSSKGETEVPPNRSGAYNMQYHQGSDQPVMNNRQGLRPPQWPSFF